MKHLMKLGLIATMLLGSLPQASAQHGKHNHQAPMAQPPCCAAPIKSPVMGKVYIDAGASLIWNSNANLSPQGFANQQAYQALSPALQVQMTIGGGVDSYGVRYKTFNLRKSVGDELSTVRLTYWGLVERSRVDLGRKFFAHVDTSLGYVHYSNKFLAQDGSQTARVWAPGVGGSVGGTLGYVFAKGFGLGLTFGLDIYSTFGWKGTESHINPGAYTGRLFGAKVNTGIYPHIGVSITGFR